MTTYPVPIQKRAAAMVKAHGRQILRLQARVDALASAQPNVGVVDRVTTSTVTVFINGNTASPATVPFLSSYTPTAGDNVLLIPAGGTMIVAGLLSEAV